MRDDPTSHTVTDWRTLEKQLGAPHSGTLLSRRQARVWCLVLEARRVPYLSRRQVRGWELLVPTDEYERAVDELRQYETENRGWPPPPPPPSPLIDNRFTTLCILALIGAFHDLTLHRISVLGHSTDDWTALGNAHAGKILAGEWWRTVTALTLHADGLHLMGNLVIGGVFIMRLCRMLGTGPGWGLVLLSGVGGNLLNALLQSPDHRAVGASTAIFGAVGLLAAINMVRYRFNLKAHRRWPLPVAAGLGLLAMLGASGENTDLGAHLWGFVIGLLLGVAVELLMERYGRPGRLVGSFLGVVTLGMVVGAWWVALT